MVALPDKIASELSALRRYRRNMVRIANQLETRARKARVISESSPLPGRRGDAKVREKFLWGIAGQINRAIHREVRHDL